MPKKPKRRANGYALVYMPDHPRCMKEGNWDGYIYEHRFVAEELVGRLLNENDIVHHIDGDRTNNSLDNLEVTTRSTHSESHNLDRYGDKPLCLRCGKVIDSRRQVYCSKKCVAGNNRKPSKREIEKLRKVHTWKQIGEMFGVTSGCVRKWYKKV